MTRLPPSGRGKNARGSGRGSPVKRTPAVQNAAGLTPDLKTNVIDYGVKNTAERLKMVMKEIATYSGTKYGTNMFTELTSRQHFVVPPPVLPQCIINENVAAEQRLARKNTRKKAMMVSKRDAIEAIDTGQRTPDQAKVLTQLVNDIEDLEDKMQQPFKRVLAGADKLTVDPA
jgi:hypothetical protein